MVRNKWMAVWIIVAQQKLVKVVKSMPIKIPSTSIAMCTGCAGDKEKEEEEKKRERESNGLRALMY